MINTVIFDIGRVLVTFEWREFLDSFHFSPEANEALAASIFASSTWNEVDRGILTDEEILARFIAAAPKYPEEIKLLYQNFPSCISEKPYTMSWVSELKDKGLSIYYLSNYGRTAYEKTREQLRFMELADGGLMSYQVNLIKPDPAFYKTLFERYGIQPEEAVFIDDNKENIEAGKALGLHTILFEDYEQAQRELEELLRI